MVKEEIKSWKILNLSGVISGSPLEAMACGLPVITVDSRKNAVRGLINENTGIISPLSPEKFSEAIIACIQKRDVMKKGCMEFASDYDWEVVAEKIESYYFSVIGKE